MRKSLVILFAILSAIMLLAIACGSDEADPNATATPAPPNTVPAADRTAEPTVAPTAVPPTSAPVTIEPTTPGSGPVTLDITVNSDALQFDLDTLSAPAGTEVVVNLNNRSATQTHNWVLVEAGTKDAVAIDGVGFPNNNWVPPNDSRIFASTVLIGPGESVKATFTAPPVGTYDFVCTFPGHNSTMFGEFIVN